MPQRLEQLKKLTAQLHQSIPPLTADQLLQLKEIEDNIMALVQSCIDETVVNRQEIERLKNTLNNATVVLPVASSRIFSRIMPVGRIQKRH
jgi:hypothetical protein